MRGSAGRSATMRGALKAACAAAVLLGGILSSASSGATQLPEHDDLSIQVTGPASIIAGYQVVYTVTITNEGEVDAGRLLDEEITVVNRLENGVFVDGCDELKDGVCTKTKNVEGPVTPGGKSSFQLDAQSFLSNLTVTSEIKDVDLANTDSSDDKATATTEVILNSTSECTYQGKPVGATKCRTGYFPPGEHVFGAHTLVVPEVAYDETPGVLGELAEVGPESDFCSNGKHNCRYGIAVLANFFKVGEFEVTDRSNPLRTIINTSKADPCRGLGAKPCSVLRYEDRPADQWATLVPEKVIPFCTVDDAIAGDQKLCIDHREKTPSGGLRFEVLLLSNDPGMY